MSAIPPIAPENQLAAAVTRVHRMRVARGACWVIVAALGVGAFLALLDSVAWLPPWVRGVGLAAWVTGIGVLVWRLVAERLPSDPTTTSLDAQAELPGNMRAAAAAAAALAASLLAATLLPGAGEHLRRVALPWSGATGPLQYRVKIASGEPVVRRGDSVTLSAYAEKLNPSAQMPEAATLICRDTTGAEWRIPMGSDESGAFHATRQGLRCSFEYRVEIGKASSDWHPVSVLDPVELTGQSTITITPPRYAPAAGIQVISGFASFTAHQFASVDFRLFFSRSTGAAFLEWRADGSAPMELIPVTLSSDRRAGTAGFQPQRDGTLSLVLVAEENGKSLRTVSTARVRTKPDAPPRFERLMGITTRPRTARPGTRIGIEFTAIDDLAIGSAEIEYLIGPGDSSSKRQAVPLAGAGTARAEGRRDFDLPEGARDGEIIRLRLRVSDTRRLDGPDLAPQETLFPEVGWSVIRIDSRAPPLDEQDILAQRDALGDALLSALQELKAVHIDVGLLRRDTAVQSRLPLDQVVRITNARDKARNLADSIRKAARDAALTPALRRLAGAVRATAEQTLTGAQDALEKCSTDITADRKAALSTAAERLGEAIGQLDDLLAMNQRVAQARLDHRTIAALAAEEAATAKLARPEGAATPEELAALQRDLLVRLRALIAQSDPLRTATALAKDAELRRLAAAEGELVAWLGDLDAAALQLDIDIQQGLLRAVAKEQEAIVGRATALILKAETAARLAGTTLPTMAQFRRIAELIEADKTVEALTELETRAEGLDTTAAALQKWAVDHRDARIAAQQLASWQEDLRMRFRSATKDRAASFEALLPALKTAFQREQGAMRQAALNLALPPGNDLLKLRRDLLQHLSVAASSLQTTGVAADDAMMRGVDGLNALAEAIPSIPDRLLRSRTEFLKLHQAQDAILLAVEQAIRSHETARRLPDLVDQQERLLAAFQAIDLPGSDGRARRIVAALSAAVSDLREGPASDALASQQWVKREFDRLRLVLDGLVALDDQANELARKLDTLARSVSSMDPSPGQKRLEALAADAQELARQFLLLANPLEAPALANEARVAAASLEHASREAVQKPEEFRKRLPTVAEAAAKLANRLNGQESELDRVRRLSASRWAAWEVGRKNQGKPPSTDVSVEASRQLARESDELAFTRVGNAGAAQKKRILDQYAKLKGQANPDRMAGLMKRLAESLDELAALMADIPDLAAPPNHAAPSRSTTDADDYLPTPAKATAFRDLAKQQRALRHRISSVAAEVVRLARPSSTNPLLDATKRQRELAEEIAAFARKLALENEALAAQSVQDAATHTQHAADQLAVGNLVSAKQSGKRGSQALRRVAAGGMKSLARTAAEFANRLETLHAELTARQFSSPVIAAQQKARGTQLARIANELAQRIRLAARASSAMEPAASILTEAANEAAAVEKLIDEATRKGAEGMAGGAAQLRGEAIQRLTASAKKVANVAPVPIRNPGLDRAASKAAEALQRSEAVMQLALEELEQKGSRMLVEKEMHTAAIELAEAAEARMSGVAK